MVLKLTQFKIRSDALYYLRNVYSDQIVYVMVNSRKPLLQILHDATNEPCTVFYCDKKQLYLNDDATSKNHLDQYERKRRSVINVAVMYIDHLIPLTKLT